MSAIRHMPRNMQSALARQRAKDEARILAEREVRKSKGVSGTRPTYIIIDEWSSLPSPAPELAPWRPGAPWIAD